MSGESQQLTTEQANDVAWASACQAVDILLSGAELGVVIGDAHALAGIVQKLAEMAMGIMLRVGQETGRTDEETRADARAWLEESARRAYDRLLGTGLVFSPAAAPIRVKVTETPGGDRG